MSVPVPPRARRLFRLSGQRRFRWNSSGIKFRRRSGKT
jgi:hypothetical protein